MDGVPAPSYSVLTSAMSFLKHRLGYMASIGKVSPHIRFCLTSPSKDLIIFLTSGLSSDEIDSNWPQRLPIQPSCSKSSFIN